jgi:protein-S-isoprenylcysteine O-methyltransferase Ste14
VYLGTVAALGLSCGLWLAKTDPALLAERMHLTLQRGQPAADKIFLLVFGLVALIWFVAIGLDIRMHGPRVPLPLQALGMAMLLISTALVMWVMRTNSFAAPMIKLQAERGQRVISTGPYAFVRHPMYSGSVLFFLGAPLLLSSWWGFAMSPLFAALFAVRIQIEERTLTSGLPGYADYASRVRYRLLPGVW